LHLNEIFEPVFIDSNPYPWPYNGNLRLDNTALIIIDMQKDFADPNGYFLKVQPLLIDVFSCAGL
jgi:hypothetical protein